MATLLTAALPQEKFVLAETLSSVQDASFEVEEIIETSEDSVMPLVWATAADPDRLDTALRNDPTTEQVELLSDHADLWFYWMEWVDHIQGLLDLLVTNRAAILTATTSDERWIVRLIFPTHDGISDTAAYCEQRDLNLEVLSIREMTGQPADRYGLTDAQFEALTTAWEQGFYRVPREAALADLAADLGVSHQALSERLRRGIGALIQDTLIVDDRPPELTRQET